MINQHVICFYDVPNANAATIKQERQLLEPDHIGRIKLCFTMKLITQEEAQAHQNAVLTGGAKGAGFGLATSLTLSYILHRRWPYYRALPPSLKALGVVMITAPWTVIEAERQGMAYEEVQRKGRQGYIDPNLNEEMAEARRRLLSPKERALDWADRHRYSIVGGSWAASMATAFGVIMRDPLQTTAQKVVQARIWAQGLTLGVLIASAGLSRWHHKSMSEDELDTVDHSWRYQLGEGVSSNPRRGPTPASNAGSK